tara:strand:+ start:78 stop:578 length:501 start_codon:yes stop_codon:yes gene_type:complete
MTQEQAEPRRQSDSPDILRQLAQRVGSYAGGGYGGNGATIFFRNMEPVSIDAEGREVPFQDQLLPSELRQALSGSASTVVFMHDVGRLEVMQVNEEEGQQQATRSPPATHRRSLSARALAGQAAANELVDALRNLDQVAMREFQAMHRRVRGNSGSSGRRSRGAGA